MRLLQFIFVLFNIAMLITASSENLSNDQLIHRSAPRKISPEIISDLIDIADLIPKAAIDAVIAEHILFDNGFRKALDFLKSSAFTKMLDKLQEESEIVELLVFLHILLPADSENDLSVPYLEIVLLEAMQQRREQRPRLNRRATQYSQHFVRRSVANDVAEITELHSFIGAVRELLAYLPHDKYKSLISEKRKKSALFDDFYRALRSAQFQPKVKAALASKNLASYVSTLNSHGIDVGALVPIAFTVISWGPNV